MIDESLEESETTDLTISIGQLDQQTIEKPAPIYPILVEKAHLTGRNVVNVLVDEDGKVISAEFISGHQIAREAVIEAALKARFPVVMIGGRRAKVSGFLTYYLR